MLPAVGFWFDCASDGALQDGSVPPHCRMTSDNRISYHRATALLVSYNLGKASGIGVDKTQRHVAVCASHSGNIGEVSLIWKTSSRAVHEDAQ